MYKDHHILSIIPARGGSKGIPRKNIKRFCGKPLIAHSILQSLASTLIDKTVVSTEDPEIAEISKRYGAEVIDRPFELSGDTCSTEPVMIDVIHKLEKKNFIPSYIVLLQPTSPIRKAEDIDNAIRTIIDKKADSLLTVRENNSFFWSNNNTPLNYDPKRRPCRQEKTWELVENGSIYITRKEKLLKENSRLSGKIMTYKMPQWASLEIDTQFDFELIEKIAIKHLNAFFYGLEKIKLVIFDVDGVFTDGSVYIDHKGQEILKFSRIDGKGIELLKNAGYEIAIITSENSEAVRSRMKKLGIQRIFTGIQDKILIYEKIKKEFGLLDQAIAYCGDDEGDIDPIKKAGFSACPNNSIDKIKGECQYVSTFKGGEGFVREICDLLVKAKQRDKY